MSCPKSADKYHRVWGRQEKEKTHSAFSLLTRSRLVERRSFPKSSTTQNVSRGFPGMVFKIRQKGKRKEVCAYYVHTCIRMHTWEFLFKVQLV